MKKIADFVKDARLINQAFGVPPSQVLALLYMIGRKDAALAHNFAHEWVHGARIGRNQNFDVLSSRIITLQRITGNNLSGTMRMALFITTFNYWNAREVVQPRAMTWRAGWRFPTLELDAEAFKQARQARERENTALIASQLRVAKALAKVAKNDVAVMSVPAIARAANIHIREVPSVINTLLKEKNLFIAEKKHGAATSYRLPRNVIEKLAEKNETTP
jgi:hypothetical protein